MSLSNIVYFLAIGRKNLQHSYLISCLCYFLFGKPVCSLVISAFLKCDHSQLKVADVTENMEDTDCGNIFAVGGNEKPVCLKEQFTGKTNDIC